MQEAVRAAEVAAVEIGRIDEGGIEAARHGRGQAVGEFEGVGEIETVGRVGDADADRRILPGSTMTVLGPRKARVPVDRRANIRRGVELGLRTIEGKACDEVVFQPEHIVVSVTWAMAP